MEGLNLTSDFAKFFTYQAFLMNGNSITSLMSLGLKSSLTGQDTKACSGRWSQSAWHFRDMTRLDAHLSDQTVFNENFIQGFIATSKKFGYNATYDINAVADLRHNRLVDSIKNSPELVFTSPRILSAYSEVVFPIIFSVDGRLNNRRLTTDGARRFFDLQRMPDDFHRQPTPVNFTIIEPLVRQIFNKHPSCPVLTIARTTTKSCSTLPLSAISAEFTEISRCASFQPSILTPPVSSGRTLTRTYIRKTCALAYVGAPY
ncbi:hypothetical protein M422DRAFT_261377 [Sphaerobolus stellatus SS14]|uniref:Unplaced genomic scaffold SPHSTscaffold_105, whole genome shotgun sequence n=1 Tax=Sphaerobolus stellatus (strain SS14) TaxID=990650 RepID=A0A0C9VFQ1_SPHS4|nr:hypothetical protein M422DRAFT_261377 [Sphaerobolus stellatus SS14]